jgi:hypothetical protein
MKRVVKGLTFIFLLAFFIHGIKIANAGANQNPKLIKYCLSNCSGGQVMNMPDDDPPDNPPSKPPKK